MEEAGLMDGKVCLITGATSGIGEETAVGLSRMGATVVIGARNESKGQAAVERIRERSAGPTVDFLVADLADQQAIRRLVDQFQSRYDRLDVLINNAGAVYLRRRLSPDDLEMTFAVNHLAPFLLTNLLMDLLQASAPARIVNVSSNSHRSGPLDMQDLQSERSYSIMRVYGKSKLANVLFTYELARRLEGTGVTANVLHPGFVKTNMGANTGWFVRLLQPLIFRSGLSLEEGAQTSIHLASSPEVEGLSGKYFVKCRPIPSSETSNDSDLARNLWQVSAELTGLDDRG